MPVSFLQVKPYLPLREPARGWADIGASETVAYGPVQPEEEERMGT